MILSEHFTDEEFRCKCQREPCPAPTQPSADLVEGLERLRAMLQQPVIITSGIRCEPYNRLVGGAPTSDHLTGEGADLLITDGHMAFLYMRAAVWLFPRVGFGRRDRDKNLTFHVGVSQAVKDVLWTY